VNISQHLFEIDYQDFPLHKVGITRAPTIDFARRYIDQLQVPDWSKKFHLFDLPPGGGKTFTPTVISFLLHRAFDRSNHFYIAPNSATYGSVLSNVFDPIKWNLEDGKTVILHANLDDHASNDIKQKYESLQSEYPYRLIISNDANRVVQTAGMLSGQKYMVYGVYTEQYVFDHESNCKALDALISFAQFSSMQIDEPQIAFGASNEENYRKDNGPISVDDPFKRIRQLSDLFKKYDNIFLFGTTGTSTSEHQLIKGFNSIFNIKYIRFDREPYSEYTKQYDQLNIIPHGKNDLNPRRFMEILSDNHKPNSRSMVKAKGKMFDELVDYAKKSNNKQNLYTLSKCMFYTSHNGLYEIDSKGNIVKFGDGTLEYARAHLESDTAHKEILVVNQAAREGFDCKSIETVMYLSNILHGINCNYKHYSVQQFLARASRKSSKYTHARIVILESPGVEPTLRLFAENLFGLNTIAGKQFIKMLDTKLSELRGPNLYSNQDLVDAALDKAFLS